MKKRRPTFKGFVAWLRKQNPSHIYNWGDSQDCAIGRYLKTVGVKDLNNLPYETYNRLEGGDYRKPCGNVARKSPHNFGAALERAEALLR